MSYLEKQTYISLTTSVIVMLIYCTYMYGYYLAGDFMGESASILVGQSIFWLIGGSIIVTIIAHIVFAFIYAIINQGGTEAEYKSDERDKQIELRGMQFVLVIFSIGILGCMSFLAFGMVAYLVFIGIILSMFIANILGDIAKMYFYHRGY